MSIHFLSKKKDKEYRQDIKQKSIHITSSHVSNQRLHDGGTASVGAQYGLDTQIPKVKLIRVDGDVVGGGPQL